MSDIDAIRADHTRWDDGDCAGCPPGTRWPCHTAVVLDELDKAEAALAKAEAALAKAPRGYHEGYDDGFEAARAECRDRLAAAPALERERLRRTWASWTVADFRSPVLAQVERLLAEPSDDTWHEHVHEWHYLDGNETEGTERTCACGAVDPEPAP